MKSKSESKSVLIVAAEASSALYARRLLQYWRDSAEGVSAFGVGDQTMVDLGFEALGRAEDMAVVGIQEVLAHLKDIKTVYRQLLAQVELRKPRFALLLDYPEFNLRLAKDLKSLGVRVVYYISPQVWAWRKGRIRHIKKYVDEVLTIFPFENEFYQGHGVAVEFVGHPLLDELDESQLLEEKRTQARQRYGMDGHHVVLGLMPGSRRSEIKNHLELQLEVARRLKQTNSNLKVAVLVAPGLSVELIQEYLKDARFPVIILRDEPFNMIQLADVVLCASGTATVMVGLLQKPMVVMYRMNCFSAFLAKCLVGGLENFAMVNLILGKSVVAERFQGAANANELCGLLQNLISHKDQRESIALELSHLRTRLGSNGATARVAKNLQKYFGD